MTVCNRNQPSWQLLSPSRVQLNPRQRCNEHFVLIPLLQLSRLPLPEPRERKWLSLILSLRALNSLIDFQSSFFACVALSSWVHMDHGCPAEATVPTGSINMNYLCVYFPTSRMISIKISNVGKEIWIRHENFCWVSTYLGKLACAIYITKEQIKTQ